MKRAVLIALVAGACLFGCSKQQAGANEWGCTFGSGRLDSKGLKGTFEPGAEGVWTNDDFTAGPADVRFYIIDSDPGTADFGGRPIIVPARGSSDAGVGVVQVSVETQVRFVFNERFCDWYVDHGKRSEPLFFDTPTGEESGWASFLNASMNQKLIEAARPVMAPEDYVTLYVNGPIGDDGELAYDALAATMSANLSRELIRDLGGEYFCGPSYQFDGTIDGELDTGCPPLEVTIKRIAPVDNTLVQRLEQIVSNEEEQKAIQSQKELELRRIEAERERTIAQAEADEQIKVAQQATREQTEVARAKADLAIAEAENDVLRQQQANAEIKAAADAAYCANLAAVGVDCALLAAAESGSYPRVIVGEGSGTSVLIDGGTGG